MSSLPNSSKDLEKDEREFVLWADHRWTGIPFEDGEIKNASLNVVPKARLQQVEAERDEARDQSNIVEISDRKRAAEYDAERYRAELSIAREALEEISETYTLGDPNPGADANHLRSLAIAALARLQAKEEGT